MGWRRRDRSKTRCSLTAYRRAHDKGLGAFAAYVKTCGYPAGVKPRPRTRRVTRKRR